MMPESDLWQVNATKMWSYHQIDSLNTSGNRYLEKITADYGQSTGIEQFCQKAAALNYDYNRAIMEAAGSRMWNGCNGVLLWMSKSAWANLNWSTYDYYYGVDGTYFGVKKACEPIHIQWDLRNWQVSVVNATQTDRNRLTAVAQVYNLNGTLKNTQSAMVNASANQVTGYSQLTNRPTYQTFILSKSRLKMEKQRFRKTSIGTAIDMKISPR